MKFKDQVMWIIHTSKPDGLVTKLRHMPEVWQDILDHTRSLSVKNNSERIYAYSKGISESPLCQCGQQLTFVSIINGYREFCSRSCVHAKQAATIRRIHAMKQNGGVGLANPKTKAKACHTLQIKHGEAVTNPGQIKSNRDRMKCLNPMFDPASIVKIGNTLSAKYGSHIHNASHIHLNQDQCQLLTDPVYFARFARGKTCTQVAKESGINYTTILNMAKKFDVLDIMVYNHRSEMEHDLKQWLLEQNISFKHDDRSILRDNREIDFLFADHNFGIELNGLPTHSELAGNKSRDYHYNKFKECEQKNITLLQFWPDEYWLHKDIIHSKILYMCGKISRKIHARHCVVGPLADVALERQFLRKNHIQGFASYRQYSMGAWHDNKLVGVMNFAHHKGRMELVRYATDINMVCVGLFSKLFANSVKQFDLFGEIISMSDNRVSNGNVYQKAGWTHVRNIPSGYCYTKDQFTREDKQHYRKQKLITKFNLSKEYVATHTEWQIMQSLGYDRLWDAGKKIWSKTVR